MKDKDGKDMWNDLGFFAVSGLGGVALSIGACVLWPRRRLPFDESPWEFGEQPVSVWTRVMSVSVPQLPIEVRRLRRDLSRAGMYDPLALERYLALRNTLLWAILLPTIFLAGLSSHWSMTVWVVGVVLLAVTYSLPGLFLNVRGNRRAQRIVNSVPDMLDIVSMCLSGGLTLEQSLAQVANYAEKTHPELARELQIVSQQSTASTAGQAFQRMADRLDEGELRSLAAIILQTERLGTGLNSAIDQLARSIRGTARQRAEARANSLALKLLFPVIFCVTPPVFFVLIVPPLVSIRDHFNSDLFQFDEAREVMSTPPDLLTIPE